MSKRGKRLEGEVGVFVKQYGRKRPRGGEPNDRRYDRKVEQKIKSIDPRELDVLMNSEDDEDY